MSTDPSNPLMYGGVQLPVMRDGELVMDAVFLLKVLDTEGKVRYRELKTPTLHAIEALGMCTTFTDTLRAAIMGGSRRLEE